LSTVAESNKSGRQSAIRRSVKPIYSDLRSCSTGLEAEDLLRLDNLAFPYAVLILENILHGIINEFPGKCLRSKNL